MRIPNFFKKLLALFSSTKTKPREILHSNIVNKAESSLSEVLKPTKKEGSVHSRAKKSIRPRPSKSK